MKNVFIIGSKGVPANYGGFETFTDNLISRKIDKNIQYYVTCISDNKDKNGIFKYNKAICKNIFVPQIGSAKAILYDIKSLNWALRFIKKNNLKNGYIYILGCTIGPLINLFKKKFKRRGFSIYLNPDGHEWERDKWSMPVKKYLKLSEISMIRSADLTICDSVAIKEYIDNEYAKYKPTTTYISYGSDISKSKLKSDSYKVKRFFEKNSIKGDNYYLVVGRFVPENNYETIIKEFMKTNTKRDLVIITDYKSNLKFFNYLNNLTKFMKDKRIKFVGTVYDQELLKYIREHCFAYIHGHSVGGTNPSLLEALGATNLNLLFNVAFNREVARNAALYWEAQSGYLSKLISKIDSFTYKEKNNYGLKAKNVIDNYYSWEKIVNKYERLFEK